MNVSPPRWKYCEGAQGELCFLTSGQNSKLPMSFAASATPTRAQQMCGLVPASAARSGSSHGAPCRKIKQTRQHSEDVAFQPPARRYKVVRKMREEVQGACVVRGRARIGGVATRVGVFQVGQALLAHAPKGPTLVVRYGLHRHLIQSLVTRASERRVSRRVARSLSTE
ncbi:hypothetical protein OH77DRAFT_1416067 [Trametes cingulata]|nr:hypothetical protein OH77DRAFT_1416067 [Trametes cingulata]